MMKSLTYPLLLMLSALLASCAHRAPEPPPMRSDTAGAAVSIQSVSPGNPGLQASAGAETAVTTQSPADVPPPPPPEKLPQPMGNAADTSTFL